MARDTSKTKKGTSVKAVPINKAHEKSQPSTHEKEATRGWRDVFENSTYSSGPGDNIYVFG